MMRRLGGLLHHNYAFHQMVVLVYLGLQLCYAVIGQLVRHQDAPQRTGKRARQAEQPNDNRLVHLITRLSSPSSFPQSILPYHLPTSAILPLVPGNGNPFPYV